jgi:hypothetical protein
MTENEYYNYAKVRGHFLKKMLGKNLDYFNAMSEEEFDTVFKKIMNYSSIVAKEFAHSEAKIPKGTENYWDYIVENFPSVKLPVYKMIPDKLRAYPPLMDEIVPALDIQSAKDLLPAKKEVKETVSEAFRDIEKSEYGFTANDTTLAVQAAKMGISVEELMKRREQNK